MDENKVNSIARKMAGKNTEELLKIWRKRDTDEWIPEAFEAIRQLLTERRVLTEAGEEIPDLSRSPKAPEILLPPVQVPPEVESNLQPLQLRQLARGDYLAKWEYERDEWREFLEEEIINGQNNHNDQLKALGVAMIIVLLALFLICRDGGLEVMWIIGLMSLALCGLFAAISYHVRNKTIKQLEQDIATVERTDSKTIAIIASDFLVLDQKVVEWSTSWARLERIYIEEYRSPKTLVLVVMSKGLEKGESYTNIPIPDGHEEEAAAIVEKLTARCPKNR